LLEFPSDQLGIS